MRIAFVALAFGCSVRAFIVAPNSLTKTLIPNTPKTSALSSTYQASRQNTYQTDDRRYDSFPNDNRRYDNYQTDDRRYDGYQTDNRGYDNYQAGDRRYDNYQTGDRRYENYQTGDRHYDNYQTDPRRNDGYQGNTRRRSIIAGNWKLNPSTATEASNLLKLLASNFRNHRTPYDTMDETSEVVVFPPFPFLELAVEQLRGSGIKIGAQNVGLETDGPYTGEVAPSMVRSLGCDYVMLGHSERRVLYRETDEDINRKVRLCLREPNLSVILCVGETLQEYENNLLRSVVDTQLNKDLLGVQPMDLRRVVIAYEPVWAIGTGRVATPDQAQEAHMAIRQTLTNLYGPDAARDVRIQYGGSVKPDNIGALMSMPDVDGALVGGASLTAESFTRIVDGGTGGLQPSRTPQSRPKELTAREVVPCKNELGESPVWSIRDQALYWISAPEEEVWKWNLRDAPYRRLVGTTLGCIALQEGERDAIVLAGEKAFLSLKMSEGSGDFATGPNIICERPEQAQATRPNDGRVDRQGRMVFGMYNNYHRSGSSAGENTCSLYRLNEDLELESIMDYKYRVSNCISFNERGDIMYFCDTPTRKIYAFDYPTGRGGKLSNRRLIWTMPSDLPGGPDGAQVDSEGFLWTALSGAGKVVRINPVNGAVDFVVRVPVKSPTSCTFGGPDLDELFITTRGPDGGGLYRVKMPYGIRGLPEPEFRVNPNIRPGPQGLRWTEREDTFGRGPVNGYGSDPYYNSTDYYPNGDYRGSSSYSSPGRYSSSPRYGRSSSGPPAQMVPSRTSFSTVNDKIDLRNRDKYNLRDRSLLSFEQYMKQRRDKPSSNLVYGHQSDQKRSKAMKKPSYTAHPQRPSYELYEPPHNNREFQDRQYRDRLYQDRSPYADPKSSLYSEAPVKLEPTRSSFSQPNKSRDRSLLSFEQYMKQKGDSPNQYAPQQAARGAAAARQGTYTALHQDTHENNRSYRKASSGLVTFEEYMKSRINGARM